MSMDEGRDVYAISPVSGSPAGWYPMYAGDSLRARAFGDGPGPVMAWWTGDTWEAVETDVLFDSGKGRHARQAWLVGGAALLPLLPLLWIVLTALDQSTSEWAFPATLLVLMACGLSSVYRRRRSRIEYVAGYLTCVNESDGFGGPKGEWSVPVAAIADVRVSRVLPAWCERSRIDVVLVDGGRLVARGVAGADVLHDLLVQHGVLSRDRIAG